MQNNTTLIMNIFLSLNIVSGIYVSSNFQPILDEKAHIFSAKSESIYKYCAKVSLLRVYSLSFCNHLNIMMDS